MYTTKSLTQCKKSRNTLSQPPEGPNSGYLVIEDDENTVPTYNNPKPSKKPPITSLPFPQNKLLTVDGHDDEFSYRTNIYLIPVINQPLSSNLYYVIQADGKHEGEAYASSKEEDKQICCFCIPCIKDVNPRALDFKDVYQQFEFSVTKSQFNNDMLVAESAAPDGHPPIFIRRHRVWEMRSKPVTNFTLKHVSGLNPSLRAQLPDFNFPNSQQGFKPLVVGTWYCPFMFIREGSEKEGIKNSVFYEMTLEQRWKRVFGVENNGYGHEKTVTVDVVVQTEVVRIGGEIAVRAYGSIDKEVVWFKSRDKEVGLSKLIMDRIIWEEERVGWVKGNQEKELRVIKEEVYEGVNDWKSFGSYVLVESFVLKRNNEFVVMTCDFMHTHQLRSKWE